MDEHIAYYQRLIAQDPKHADAHLHLAALLCRQGKRQEAISTYQAAATLLSDAGQLQEAIAASKSILDIDPQHTDTHLTLARLYARLPQAGARIAQVIVPAPVLAPLDDPVEDAELIVLSPASAIQGSAASPTLAPAPAPPSFAPNPELEGDDDASERDLAASVSPPLDDVSLMEAVEQGLAAGSIDIAMDDEGPLSLEELLERSDDIFSSDGFEALLRDSIHHSLTDDPAHAGAAQKPADARPAHAARPHGDKGWSSRTEPGSVADAVAQALASNLGRPSTASNLSVRASQAVGRLSRGARPAVDELGLPGVRLPPTEAVDEPSPQATEYDAAELAASVRLASGPRPAAPRHELRLEDVTLPPSPLLMRLSSEEQAAILRRAKLRRVRQGERLNDEPSPPHTLSLLVDGRVRVERHTPEGVRCLARVERGAFFGEVELLTGRMSEVSLLAETPLIVMELSRTLLGAIADKDPTIWQVLWTCYHERLLNNLLALSPLFGKLSVDERAALSADFTRVEVHAEQAVVRQGQPDHGLYLVARGALIVKTVHQHTAQTIAELEAGDFFGTLAGVARPPAQTSVSALQESTLFVLRHSRLRSVVKQHPEAEAALRRLGAPHRLVVGKGGALSRVSG